MKKTKRELEIRQAAVEHEWPVVFDDIFAEGAEWADTHPYWICVEDELPPKDDDFIIDLSIYVLATDGKTINLCYYDYNKECWFDGDLWKCDNITHWMQLPAPPTGDKSSPDESSSEIPNNCKKFDMKGYENVVIHEGNAKGGILKGGKK